MKILDTQLVNVIIKDSSDAGQNDSLRRVLERCTYKAPLGVLTPETIIYIPYDTWRNNGGAGCLTPDFVKLVHGLDEVVTDISKKRVRPRQFLVPDQASTTGLAPRIHMAAHERTGDRIRILSDKAYCGEVNLNDGVAPTLDAVTCHECLMELKRINKVH